MLREEVTFLSSLVTLYLPIYSLVIFFVTTFFSLFYLFNYFKVVNKRVLQAYDQHFSTVIKDVGTIKCDNKLGIYIIGARPSFS